jgi:hypothetical protein
MQVNRGLPIDGRTALASASSITRSHPQTMPLKGTRLTGAFFSFVQFGLAGREVNEIVWLSTLVVIILLTTCRVVEGSDSHGSEAGWTILHQVSRITVAGLASIISSHDIMRIYA